MGPPIDYIMVVPRKKRPKSARKVHRPRKSEEKRHPPPTDDGGGGNTYDTMGLGRLFSQAGGKRRKTRKKRGKGPQQRAVAGKFVGNILSKYKPKAKRKKPHTAKKADRAPRRPVAGDIVEVQDYFLSLSPTFQQVSDEYYGGDHGPKWFLAKLTGIARSRRRRRGAPGRWREGRRRPVRIRAPAGAHYQGIAEVYLTSNDHYRIQLLNAAGEDAGQGTQYVSSIRFPPGDGGKKYTWHPARRAVVARH